MKICPVMSTPDKQVPCNKDCAWYCDDAIPSMCMLKDVSFTLNRIEHRLDDIESAIIDNYED